MHINIFKFSLEAFFRRLAFESRGGLYINIYTTLSLILTAKSNLISIRSEQKISIIITIPSWEVKIKVEM